MTNSTTSQITIDAGGAMLTFAAPAGHTLPVIATGTFVEARGVTINGVLTLTRLRIEDLTAAAHGTDDGGGCDGTERSRRRSGPEPATRRRRALRRQTAGGMFRFIRNRFSGSYFAFSSASRS